MHCSRESLCQEERSPQGVKTTVLAAVDSEIVFAGALRISRARTWQPKQVFLMLGISEMLGALFLEGNEGGWWHL